MTLSATRSSVDARPASSISPTVSTIEFEHAVGISAAVVAPGARY